MIRPARCTVRRDAIATAIDTTRVGAQLSASSGAYRHVRGVHRWIIDAREKSREIIRQSIAEATPSLVRERPLLIPIARLIHDNRINMAKAEQESRNAL